MTRRQVTSGIEILAIGLLSAGTPLPGRPALASPDGADWAVADTAEGCRSCHLGDADSPPANALGIAGLPAHVVPGDAYALTISIEDPSLKNAGFLLTIRSASGNPGTLNGASPAIETQGAQARSTWDSSFPPEPGRASWDVVWTAPEVIDAILQFDLWGNAGNDDLSPLGDRPQHRIWEIAPSRELLPDLQPGEPVD